MIKIKEVKGRKILNSRCEWTVEVEVNYTRGSSPSGASRGKYEAKTIPAEKAVNIINKKLKNLIEGKEFNQKSLDELLKKEGGKDFSRLGGNTAIAISSAFFNHTFKLEKEVFPLPLGNVIGGGKHGGHTDIQEFLILPYKAKDIHEAASINIEFYKKIKEILGNKFLGINDEGALTSKLNDIQTLELLLKVSENFPVKLGIDMAASELWDGKNYIYKNSNKKLSPGEQIDFVKELIEKYNLYYVEDPFHENDFESFKELKSKVKNKLICGDDLTVTNPERIKKAIENNSINSIIIKPNQIGTISLTHDAVKLAKKKNILPVISHRSGETSDVSISRIALNWEIPIIKGGIFGFRTLKMNELFRLWGKAKNPKMVKLN